MTAAPEPLLTRLAAALGLPESTPAEEVAAMVERLVAALHKLSAKPMAATAAELATAAATFVPDNA